MWKPLRKRRSNSPPISVILGTCLFSLNRGVYKISPAERLAPFYRGPTRRIAAFSMPRSSGYLVFLVETLVELAEGCEIGWEEWKKYVVIPPIHQPDLVNICVSGYRLFCVTSPEYGPDADMEVYDFSG